MSVGMFVFFNSKTHQSCDAEHKPSIATHGNNISMVSYSCSSYTSEKAAKSEHSPKQIWTMIVEVIVHVIYVKYRDLYLHNLK